MFRKCRMNGIVHKLEDPRLKSASALHFQMKSNTYELHNYADLNDMARATDSKDSRKRKTASARGEKYSLRQKRQKRGSNEDGESANLADFQLELDPIAEPASKSESIWGLCNEANRLFSDPPRQKLP